MFTNRIVVLAAITTLTFAAGCGSEIGLEPTPKVIYQSNTITETITVTEIVEVPVKDTDTNSCAPFYWETDDYYTTSKPVVELATNELHYYFENQSFSGHGAFYTASGCGTGYTIRDLAIQIDDLPAIMTFANTTAGLWINQIHFPIDCLNTSDGFGDNEIWCIVEDVNIDVLSNMDSAWMEFMVYGMPYIPPSHEMTATVFIRWEDLDTGYGYKPVSWRAVDSDSMSVIPYE